MAPSLISIVEQKNQLLNRGTQCNMQMWSLLIKNYEFQGSHSRALPQAWGPSRLGPCVGLHRAQVWEAGSGCHPIHRLFTTCFLLLKVISSRLFWHQLSSCPINCFHFSNPITPCPCSFSNDKHTVKPLCWLFWHHLHAFILFSWHRWLCLASTSMFRLFPQTGMPLTHSTNTFIP